MRPIPRLLFVLLSLVAPAMLSAQIPPRKTVAVATTSGVRRLLVATPEVETGVELARAVELAEALRQHLIRGVGGKYQVVSREALNRVLASSGYEADAPLGEAAVRALGTQLQAAYVVCATVRLEAGGRLSMAASLAPPGEAESPRQTVTQESGLSLNQVAAALADQLLSRVR